MIFGKLLPRDDHFFDLFNQHGEALVEGARAFIAMVHHYDDLVLRQRHAAQVDAAERQADRITGEVNQRLHKSLIPPLGREQIHALINAMDDILDLLRDVTETMALYDVRTMTREVIHLAELSVRCCERVRDAVALLPGLDKPEVAEGAMKTCEEIDRLESDADRVMNAAMSRLFREEPDVRELIKLKGIYERLESVSDRCEDVATLIEAIVLKSS